MNSVKGNASGVFQCDFGIITDNQLYLIQNQLDKLYPVRPDDEVEKVPKEAEVHVVPDESGVFFLQIHSEFFRHWVAQNYNVDYGNGNPEVKFKMAKEIGSSVYNPDLLAPFINVAQILSEKIKITSGKDSNLKLDIGNLFTIYLAPILE